MVYSHKTWILTLNSPQVTQNPLSNYTSNTPEAYQFFLSLLYGFLKINLIHCLSKEIFFLKTILNNLREITLHIMANLHYFQNGQSIHGGNRQFIFGFMMVFSFFFKGEIIYFLKKNLSWPIVNIFCLYIDLREQLMHNQDPLDAQLFKMDNENLTLVTRADAPAWQ